MKNIFSIKNILILLLIGANSLSLYTNYQNKQNYDRAYDLQQSTISSLKEDNTQLSEEKDKIIEEKTALENKKLPSGITFDVPQYQQTHSASCEAAAAHAAMSYFGSEVTEDQIIEQVGQDDTERYIDDNGVLHWGNPQVKFVGNVDAKKVYIDGYGVYNDPIYKVLSANGFSKSVSKVEWDTNELYDYVKQGYPVIVWISNDYKTKKVTTMVAPDGSENPYMVGEHAVVIRGVDEKNVYVMDVGGGDYQTITKTKFETGFANLKNMAIAVIPD